MPTTARVILQPAGGPDAGEHYTRTIRNPIRLSSILEFLEERDADALAVQYPTGWTRVWGVTPGSSGVDRAKWLQFARGDRVLFCGHGKVFASASLRYRLRNRALALNLWGSDEDGQTWEYVYFVGELRDQNITYTQLGTVLHYSPDYVVLGVNILDEDKSRAVLEAFDLTDD
jgi:hypothetical protein